MDRGERVHEGSVQIQQQGVIARHEPWRFGLAAGRVTSEVGAMAAPPETSSARATAQVNGAALDVALAGTWQITAPRPDWDAVAGRERPMRVRFNLAAVEKWDTSLLLFLFQAQQWSRVVGAFFDLDTLPERVRTLLAQLSTSHETSVPFDRSESFLTSVGLATQDTAGKAREISRFVGECVLAAVTLLRHPRKFRWRDCLA